MAPRRKAPARGHRYTRGEIAQQQTDALQLHMIGTPEWQIASNLDVSRATVQKRIPGRHRITEPKRRDQGTAVDELGRQAIPSCPQLKNSLRNPSTSTYESNLGGAGLSSVSVDEHPSGWRADQGGRVLGGRPNHLTQEPQEVLSPLGRRELQVHPHVAGVVDRLSDAVPGDAGLVPCDSKRSKADRQVS